MSDLASAALAVEQTIRIEAPRERVFALLTDVADAAPDARGDLRAPSRWALRIERRQVK